MLHARSAKQHTLAYAPENVMNDLCVSVTLHAESIFSVRKLICQDGIETYLIRNNILPQDSGDTRYIKLNGMLTLQPIRFS
jgi:hypothetical protein